MRTHLLKLMLKGIDYVLWTDLFPQWQYRYIGFHDPIYQFKEDEIAFIHIPKTGGTSLHKALSNDKQSRFVGMNKHRPISKLCPPDRYSYITIMRNPVDRVWSFYQMVRRRGPNYPYKRFADRGIECFVKRCWEARNMACRYYSTDIRSEPDTNTLKVALDNLAKFDYALDFDDFESGAAELLQHYGIQREQVPHERKASYIKLSQAEYKFILLHNELDMELYRRWKANSHANNKEPLRSVDY